MAIIGLKNQEGINLEIIVSEQNQMPKFDATAKRLGIGYIYEEPYIFDGKPRYNPSAIRNMAVSRVQSEFVYLNDSDVLFPNKRFLRTLADTLSPVQALIKPPMRRIIAEDVQEFIVLANSAGVDVAISRLNISNEFVATMGKKQIALKVINHNSRVYTIDLAMFQRYKSDPSLKGMEPTLFYDIVHCGGVFTRMDLVKSVGGYCEQYWTWGYEDTDIQWKLGQKFEAQMITHEAEFETLHLDHPKGYFSAEDNLKNRHLFAGREAEGVDIAVEYDKKNNRFYIGD